MNDSFTLSFRPDIELIATIEQIVLRSPLQSLTLEQPRPGLKAAFEQLQNPHFTARQLSTLVAKLDGASAAAEFELELQKLIGLGWICHAVQPLAIAIPLGDNYEFVIPRTDWQQQSLALSRFAFLHQSDRQLVLESPLAKAKILLLNWQATALIAQLTQFGSAFTAQNLLDIGIAPSLADALLLLLIATKMITLEPESPALALWQLPNLLFHRYTRLRFDAAFNLRDTGKDIDRGLLLKPPMSDRLIPLAKPNLATLAQTDISLTQAIESRQSLREYDRHQPITLSQLADFLYRCARVKEVYTPSEENMKIMGDLTKRPYPSGGSFYELEIYPIICHCAGLDAGIYHYQPLAHTLHRITNHSLESESLLFDLWRTYTSPPNSPQVIIIITARFGRLFWKYPQLGYSLVLKHVGVLYQNFYLVATAMQLALCAMGTSSSELFGKIVGLDEYEESSVGEFALGSLPPKTPPFAPGALS
jgi:oxazoline/thiazoline dehydrogenase